MHPDMQTNIMVRLNIIPKGSMMIGTRVTGYLQVISALSKLIVIIILELLRAIFLWAGFIVCLLLLALIIICTFPAIIAAVIFMNLVKVKKNGIEIN